MSDIYLVNGTFIDYSSGKFIKNNIKVSEGENGEIEFSDFVPKNAKTMDCSGKFIIKSFVNSHHHIYSALATGMPAPERSPSDFYEILKYVWWKLDKSLTRDIIEISALTAAIDSIRSGVTFIIDHHSSPNAIIGSLGTIKEKLDSAGVSSLLCYELSDRDGKNIVKSGLEETESYLRNNDGLVGLHASFTVSDELLRDAINLAKNFNTGIHIHAAEDSVDQKITLEKYGMRVIERLEKSGALSMEKSILAHCIHIDNHERDLLRSSKAWVVQNPESNLNNGVGVFNPESVGDRIMLGTDGMNGDMINSARNAYMTGNLSGGNSPKDIYLRLRKSHKYLEINRFTGDGDNNLVVLDYNPGSEFNSDNFYSHFIYGMNKGNIDSVISNGKIIMKEKKITNIDEKSILRRSRELSTTLWKRMEKL